MTRRSRDAKATTLTVGRFADAAGVNAGTIRFYERSGLLRTAERTNAGYRVYDSADLDRVRFIQRAKYLGFTLDEIAKLLALNDERISPTIRAAAEQRLVEVEDKLGDMVRMRDALRSLIQSCQSDVPTVEHRILQTLVPESDATPPPSKPRRKSEPRGGPQ